MLSYKLAKPLNVKQDKICIVGNPVRQDFLNISRAEARRNLGLDDKDTVVLSYSGSLGAKKVNEAFCSMAKLSAEDGLIIHYHGAARDFGFVKETLKDIKNNSNIRIFEYIYNMPEVMAAADLIISRLSLIHI